MEAAAERIELAGEVARLGARMSAVSSVLEMIGVQKQTLLARRAGTSGPLAALYDHQIATLTAQEVAVLERIGVGGEQARKAVQVVDATPEPDACGKVARSRRGVLNGAAGQG